MPDTTPKPKRNLLPLLILLFVASYALMSMLIVEQGRTIDSQSYLIHDLFRDSGQLTAMKGKAIQNQQAQAKAQAKTQEKVQEKNEMAKGRSKPLQKPPEDTADRGRIRRSLISL